MLLNRLFYPLTFILIATLVFTKTNPAQVVLSEVMYDAFGSDAHDEFIEIFNISYSDSVDLSGWSISDSLAVDQLTDAGFGLMLLPRQYAVILDGSYRDNSTTYDNLIPPSALKITIDDKAIGSGGLTNSYPKVIELIDEKGSTVQRYRYTVNNQSGFSDEKIVISTDNADDNWGNSTVLYGTPGFQNSLTPLDIDPAVEAGAITYAPSLGIKSRQLVKFVLAVTNQGLETFHDSLQVRFYIDQNMDSSFSEQDSVLIHETTFVELQAHTQIHFFVNWIPVIAARYLFILEISAKSDQNLNNNRQSETIYVMESLESLCINEIKFLTHEDEPEWIELFNFGDEPLLLQHWGVADLRDTTWINQPVYIQPQDFVVISADSSIIQFYDLPDLSDVIVTSLPTLNNDEDVVFLLNPAGGWIDQAPYEADWLEGAEWRKPSLEKIHYNLNSQIPASWGPSVSEKYATPGRPNSIFTQIKPEDTRVSIEPNPFSPDGDEWENHTVIQVEAPVMSGRIRAEIFDILGRKIRQLSAGSYTGSHYTLVWNGRDDKGQIVRMGLYVLWIQVLDDRNGVLLEKKETIAVAKQ